MSSYTVTFNSKSGTKNISRLPSLNAALSIAKNPVCWPDLWSDDQKKSLYVIITNDYDGAIEKSLTYQELKA